MLAVSQASGDYSTKGEAARNEAAKSGGLPTRTRTRTSIEPSLCVLPSCLVLIIRANISGFALHGRC